MDIQLINIGFGNIVSANRVIAIVSPESAPIKRIIREAKEKGHLVTVIKGMIEKRQSSSLTQSSFSDSVIFFSQWSHGPGTCGSQPALKNVRCLALKILVFK